MKRFIVFLLVIQLLLLTGCTFPFFGNSSDQPSGITDDKEMVKVPEGGQMNSTGNSILDDVPGNAANGAANSAVNSVAGSTTNGAANSGSGEADSAAAGAAAPPVLSDVAGTAIASSDSTGTMNSTVNGITQPIAQAVGGAEADLPAGSAVSSLSDTGTAPVESKYPVTVYYQEGDGYLIPMTRWIQLQQGIARAAVSLCIDSAIVREEIAYYGVYPVIPEDTDILGIDIRDGIATIDFDRHLLNYNNAASERNIITSIIYTLTEFKTISKVRILINGYQQSLLKYGTNISEALGREDIIINGDTLLLEDGQDKADVFLFKKANEGFTYLVPVSAVYSEYAGELPEKLVKQLLGMNSNGSLYTEMPEGVELLEYSFGNGVLTLDFSESFTEYGGNEREEGILKQLAYTERLVEGIKKLKILVEGQKAELPEGTEISAGLVIPATINDVMDR